MTTRNDTIFGIGAGALERPVVVEAVAGLRGTNEHGASGVSSDRLIITIDGPAGTGKSTVARSLARRLGVQYLDTGAMYRAAAAIAIDRQIDTHDHRRFVSAVERLDLHFDFETDPPTLHCAGESIMHRLRDPDVTAIVSAVASISELRQDMVRKQRQIAMAHPFLVTEGRDQGSVVFPEADVKFYLHASARVRAERRASELAARGRPSDLSRLEQEIIGRDRSDSTRTDGPLTCPADAHVIDTSDMTAEQVVDALEAHVRRLIGARDSERSSGRLRSHRAGHA